MPWPLFKRRDFLVAIVQPKSLDILALKSTMARVLPVHALLRHIVAVDDFPLTEYPASTPNKNPLRLPVLNGIITLPFGKKSIDRLI